MGIESLAAEEIQRYFNANMHHDIIQYSESLSKLKLDSKTYHIIAASCAIAGNEDVFRETIGRIQLIGAFCSTTAYLLARCSDGITQSSYSYISRQLKDSKPGYEIIERKLETVKVGLNIDSITIFYDNGGVTPSWPFEIDRGSQVLVVSWDSATNAMGRAAILCEVSKESGYGVCLLGLKLESQGLTVWPPLLENNRDYCIDLMGYSDIYDLFLKALEYAKKYKFEIVWVSKTRPVSLILGYVYKLVWGSKIIVDVDDYEGSFSGTTFMLDEWIEIAKRDLGAQSIKMLREQKLTSELWGLFAERMINFCDAITVSSETINSAYGNNGIVLRHLRSTSGVNDRQRYALYGGDGTIKVLFNGTIRRHKGVRRLVQWLEMIACKEQPISLIVYEQDGIGRLESEIHNEHLRLVTLRSIKYSDNISLCAQVDVVCTLQDIDSLVSRYQTPAKISDALLAGARIIGSSTEPLRELQTLGLTIDIVDDDFEQFRELLMTKSKSKEEDNLTKQVLGLEGYSIDLSSLNWCTDTPSTRRSEWFDKISRELSAILGIDVYRLGYKIQRFDSNHKIDVIYYWRQHDTGDYPRRQHAIARRLARHEKVGHVLHLEPPVSRQALNAHKNKERILSRYKGIDEDSKLSYHTYIYDSAKPDVPNSYFKSLGWHGEFISKRLAERSVGNSRIMWVYPPFQDIGWLLDGLASEFLVADFVDNAIIDPSTREEDRKYLEEQYRYFASNSDLQLVNCSSMKDVVQNFGGRNVLLVENAYPSRSYKNKNFGGQIRKCVYTGNMNGRIDWDLLTAVAEARQDIEFFLYGDCRLDVEWIIGTYSNITYCGIQEPEKLQEVFDDYSIAFVPHQENEKTKHMNLLKYYEYRRIGVPVITTCKWNIPDDENIFYCQNVDQVLQTLEQIQALGSHDSKVFQPSREFIQANSWESRMDLVWRSLNKLLDKTPF
jgi:glycosyltransferase involved in cell wall biosynthesis